LQKKRNKNYYFTKVHENAIIEYARTDDLKVRTRLYIDYIQPAFREVVSKIVFTYKFTNLPNIDSLKQECEIWLTTILDKYDPSKGSKAFSYFSVVTKNHFIYLVKKNSKKLKREIPYDKLPAEIENEFLSDKDNYDTKREEQEFWLFLSKEIEDWEYDSIKPNEKKILEAIKLLFENIDQIEIFSKKAVYLYLREITGLNTKQIVSQLNKIRTKYRIFKKEWEEGKI